MSVHAAEAFVPGDDVCHDFFVRRSRMWTAVDVVDCSREEEAAHRSTGSVLPIRLNGQGLDLLDGEFVIGGEAGAILEFRRGVDHPPVPPCHLEAYGADRSLNDDHLALKTFAVDVEMPKPDGRRFLEDDRRELRAQRRRSHNT